MVSAYFPLFLFVFGLCSLIFLGRLVGLHSPRALELLLGPGHHGPLRQPHAPRHCRRGGAPWGDGELMGPAELEQHDAQRQTRAYIIVIGIIIIDIKSYRIYIYM